MKKLLNTTLVIILAITAGTLLAASSTGGSKSIESEMAAKILDKSAIALENITEDPVNGIPESVINQSGGIVILPGACQVAPGAYNIQGGRGIAMIHNEDGSWSNPLFISLGKGSPGFQLGTPGSDIILLFKDRKDIIDLHNSKIILGSDIKVAPGPVNGGSSPYTEITFVTEIYSYHRSEGHYSGLNLKGGILTHYEKLSESYYGSDDIKMDEIFYPIEKLYTEKVNDLIVDVNIREDDTSIQGNLTVLKTESNVTQ
jgi:lipid-binding SYLF domain-containing protein